MAGARFPVVSLLLLAVLPTLFLSSCATPHHQIILLLSQFPEYSTFTSMINQTKIPARVQVHNSITILALDNAAASSLSGLDNATLEDILSVHIILDYFDVQKLHRYRRRATIVTTLFQSTGRADHQMGFLNVTKLVNKQVAFGSAKPHSPLVALLKGSVTNKPYTISVLEISGPIIPPGIDGTNIVQSPLQNIQIAPPPPAAAPGPSVDDEDYAAAPDSDVSDEADSPSDAPAPAPADADADEDDDAADEVPAPKKHATKEAQESSAGGVAVSASLGLAMGGAILSLQAF